MSSGAVAAVPAAAAEGEAPAKKRGKKKLLLLAMPLVLVGVLAGLWFGGILPPLLGMGPKPAAKPGAHPADQPAAAAQVVKPPAFVDVPEMIANLNSPGRRQAFVKLKARIEVARPEDVAVVQADMPRVLDMLQTYLRETRPDELRGSAGTWRLREELIARANIAVAPARVVDVLFTEMLIQ